MGADTFGYCNIYTLKIFNWFTIITIIYLSVLSETLFCLKYSSSNQRGLFYATFRFELAF